MIATYPMELFAILSFSFFVFLHNKHAGRVSMSSALFAVHSTVLYFNEGYMLDCVHIIALDLWNYFVISFDSPSSWAV